MIEIPNYTIDKEIGHGGMATVYLAVQNLLKRNVALKVMLPEMARDKNFRNSFMSEGTIIASLEHVNIVRIHDIGMIDETILYMAMEYLGGGTLKEKLSNGKLSFSDSSRILEQVSSGLAYAHDKGYIHRDIKPGNILFRQDGTVVITDFGIAKLQDTSGELTRMGFTMGTAQYMSPEQVVTTDLDKRSDIYSLGLIFYEMLTGLKAFKAESTIQAIHQHTTLPPPKLDSEYSYLQHVIDKVLAKEPENRYQNAGDFVRAVNEADQLDKTLIYRIDDTASDKTRLYIPEKAKDIATGAHQVTGVDKKKRNLLIPTLVSVLLLGIVIFGIFNYMDLGINKTVSITESDSPVTKPVITNRQVEINPKPIVEIPPNVIIASVAEKPQSTLNPETKNKIIIKMYEPNIYHDEIEKELDGLAKKAKEILAIAPDNNKAQQTLNYTSDRYYSIALDQVKSMEVDRAVELVNKGLKISGSHLPLIKLKNSIDRKNGKVTDSQLKIIEKLNDEAENHMRSDRYVLPKGNNALEVYQKILTIDPHNQIAREEINSLLFVFEEQIRINLSDNKYQANEFLNQALAITPFNKRFLQLQKQIKENQSSKL